MRQGAYVPYALLNSNTRYVVVWTMFWEIVWFEQYPAGADLNAAMTAAIANLDAEGRVAESNTSFACAFLRKGDKRRLLMLTPKDPQDAQWQAFDPFRTDVT